MSEFDPDQEYDEIPDPYGYSFATFKDCAMLIKRCIQGVIDILAKE